MKKNNILRLSLVLLSCASFLAGCGEVNLESSRVERPILIDGKYSDWDKAQTYYDENKKFILNLCNDADYLYICLITRNRTVETQLMDSGFVVWFDPEAGRKKSFGMRFPIGMKNMGMSITENERRSRSYEDTEDAGGWPDKKGGRQKEEDFAKKLETLEGLQDKIEIITAHPPAGRPPEGAGKDIAKGKKGPPGMFPKDNGIELSLDEAAKLGIEAKMGHENGYFVYELKVPLIKSPEHPYAIELRKDKIIGLGLEVQRGMMMGGGMGGPPGGGGGGPPGGGGRMPPGAGQGESSMFPGNLQLWATVILS